MGARLCFHGKIEWECVECYAAKLRDPQTRSKPATPDEIAKLIIASRPQLRHAGESR